MRTRTTARSLSPAPRLAHRLPEQQRRTSRQRREDKASTSKPSVAAKRSAEPSPTADKPRDFGEILTFNDSVTAATIKATVLGYEQVIKAQSTADQEFNTIGYE
ncbi:hypothetical protein [Streptomyces sp. NPDC051776]|uniref:hypothetical protein n=1 Tax=Streptomyces sp. NPDC051776 TaxID=3155414 RepID=UPI003439723D